MMWTELLDAHASKGLGLMSNDAVTAVLCGDLNMLRCFVGSAIPTVVVSSREDDVTFHSRYCRAKRVIAEPRSNPEKAVAGLLELGRTFNERPALFYGDDAMLLLVSRHREMLEKHYRFLMPNRDLVEDIVDKTRFADLAERAGLPTPRTVRSTQMGSPEEVEQHLSLPVILKPNFHLGWFRSKAIIDQGGKPQKVFRANDLAELKHLYGKIQEFTHDFIIQEYIAGGDDCIFSFHTYLDQSSTPLAYYVGRKIRTYPKDSGVSTYLKLVKQPEVVEAGLDILKRLNLVGPVKIDFKKDASRNRLYLLELNARFNLWNYLGAISGINLPVIAYADLLGRQRAQPKDYNTSYRWLSFGNDFRAFLRDYHPDGDLSWGRWLLSFKARKIYDIFAWSDPYPFAASILDYFKALFTRWAKGATR